MYPAKLTHHTTKSFVENGLPFSIECRSNAPIPLLCQRTFILLHGVGFSSASLRFLGNELLLHYPNSTILLVDLPGHGEAVHQFFFSPDASFEAVAKALHDLLVTYSLTESYFEGEVTFFGHGVGANFGAALAQQGYPIERLVVSGPVVDYMQPIPGHILGVPLKDHLIALPSDVKGFDEEQVYDFIIGDFYTALDQQRILLLKSYVLDNVQDENVLLLGIQWHQQSFPLRLLASCQVPLVLFLTDPLQSGTNPVFWGDAPIQNTFEVGQGYTYPLKSHQDMVALLLSHGSLTS